MALTTDDDETLDFGMLPSLLGYQLRRAQLIVFQNFARHLQDFDVTPTQFAVLTLIAANYGLSQRALSAAAGTDQSSLVSLLDRLQARGWIARRKSQRDRRFHVLSLTDDGSKKLEEVNALVRKQDDLLANGLSADERQELMRLLSRLSDSYES